MEKKVDLTVLSLGAGVQSSFYYLAAIKGEVPAPDVAIFADTQWEPEAVYRNIEMLEKKGNSIIPIHKVTIGNIRKDALSGERFATMPIYTSNCNNGEVGRLRRQCTIEYKLQPIYCRVREILGVKHGTGKLVNMIIGFSFDELIRMKPAKLKWVKNIYPLVDLGITRRDCENWLESEGLKVVKSSCIGCPFHDNYWWHSTKEKMPNEFEDACDFDKAIRRLPRVRDDCYLHRDCKPLDEVDFGWDVKDTFPFMNECEGVCGI